MYELAPTNISILITEYSKIKTKFRISTTLALQNDAARRWSESV